MSGGVDTERVVALESVAQKVLGAPVAGTAGGEKREDPEPHGSNGPSSTTSPRKRLRRHHHNNHRKQSTRKRIRRNTQPAPNNTNEFLMQEHDHLFHLDSRAEEVEADPALSSSEDEDTFLNQDFTAMYDVVHQERLSLMTKPELIMEYQLLEERVESLERKLKSGVLRSRPDLISPLPPPPPEDDPDSLQLIQEEVNRLREENRKLKADNRSLRKLCYNPIPGHIVPVVNGVEDPGSTDSGAGSGSGSDTATPEELNINKMIKRL